MAEREYITRYLPGSKRPTRILAESNDKRIGDDLEEMYADTEAAEVTHSRVVVSRTPDGFTTPQRRVVSSAPAADLELFGRENPWSVQHPAEDVADDRTYEEISVPGSRRNTRILVSANDAELDDNVKLNFAGQSPGTVAPVTTGTVTATPASTSVALNWGDVANADYYEVEREGAIVGNPTASAYSDTGLTASTLYHYRVRAVTGDARGPWTSVNSTTTA